MKQTIDRDQLFAYFKPEIHPKLDEALARYPGLAVYQDLDGRAFAVPTETADAPEIDTKGRALAGVFLQNRLRRALAHLQEHPETTPYAAARLYGVATQSLYGAIKRKQRHTQKAANPVCACCGQPLPKP
jgi:hypothetical protein